MTVEPPPQLPKVMTAPYTPSAVVGCDKIPLITIDSMSMGYFLDTKVDAKSIYWYKVLGIDQNGNYFLNGRPLAGGANALEDQLRSIFASRTEDKILYFKADNQLKYSKVQEAVETARRSGVRVMAAITEPNKAVVFGDDDKKGKK